MRQRTTGASRAFSRPSKVVGTATVTWGRASLKNPGDDPVGVAFLDEAVR
jgi:hypothetical protein